MLGLGALGQFPLGGGPYGTATTLTFGWYRPLSEPVRYRRPPRQAVAINNQYFAMNPFPRVSFGWYGQLSLPTWRKKPGLAQSRAPFIAFNPRPFVSFGWYGQLSLPTWRKKPGMPAPWQLFQDTSRVPNPSTLMQWYNWFSEPVRFKVGLKPYLQQAYTAPLRDLPNPSVGVQVTLQAVETNNDEAIIAIRIFQYNAPASAAVSIVELSTDGSFTSVSES